MSVSASVLNLRTGSESQSVLIRTTVDVVESSVLLTTSSPLASGPSPEMS